MLEANQSRAIMQSMEIEVRHGQDEGREKHVLGSGSIESENKSIQIARTMVHDEINFVV